MQYLSLNKMAIILQATFSNAFLEIIFRNFDGKFVPKGTIIYNKSALV